MEKAVANTAARTGNKNAPFFNKGEGQGFFSGGAERQGFFPAQNAAGTTIHLKPAPKAHSKDAPSKHTKDTPSKATKPAKAAKADKPVKAAAKPRDPFKAPGFDGTTDGTFISLIEVHINFQGQSKVNLTWKNKEVSTAKDKDFVFQESFNTTPGAGRCNRDCSDKDESNIDESECTPIGSGFLVEKMAPNLSDDDKATHVTYFLQKRGIAFHYYDPTPPNPASHGCARLSKDDNDAAEWIQNNSIIGETHVHVNGTGKDTKKGGCYLIGKKLVTAEKYNSMTPLEKADTWTKLAIKFDGKAVQETYIHDALKAAGDLSGDDLPKWVKSLNRGEKGLSLFYSVAAAAPDFGDSSPVTTALDARLHPPAKTKDKETK